MSPHTFWRWDDAAIAVLAVATCALWAMGVI
jgi:hypothetical protein